MNAKQKNQSGAQRSVAKEKTIPVAEGSQQSITPGSTPPSTPDERAKQASQQADLAVRRQANAAVQHPSSQAGAHANRPNV